jgi:cell pole-organizing protein PopZ
MDEILASIRRIISDDEAPAAEAIHAVPAEPESPPPPLRVVPPAEGPLLGEAASATSASAFDRLSSVAADAAVTRPVIAMPPPGRTLEDVTRDLLRPMLKAWLDEHLPAIVQDRVDEEVARISRGRVR